MTSLCVVLYHQALHTVNLPKQLWPLAQLVWRKLTNLSFLPFYHFSPPRCWYWAFFFSWNCSFKWKHLLILRALCMLCVMSPPIFPCHWKLNHTKEIVQYRLRRDGAKFKKKKKSVTLQMFKENRGRKMLERRIIFVHFSAENILRYILMHLQSSRWAFWKRHNGISAKGLIRDYLAIE